MANEIAVTSESAQADDIVLFDESVPNSLINIVPDKIKECIQSAFQKNPELFHLDEFDLSKHLSANYRRPTPTENRLRLKFWFEFDRVQEKLLTNKTKMDEVPKINITNVIGNICSREFFYSSYITHPSKLAWLLCIPANYQNKSEEALEFGFDQVRDILSQPHTYLDENKNERIDVQFASLKFKIFENLANRVKGSIVQRTENKSVSMNMNTSDRKLIREMATAMSEEDLVKKLQELERMERRSLHLPDVTPAIEIEIKKNE